MCAALSNENAYLHSALMSSSALRRRMLKRGNPALRMRAAKIPLASLAAYFSAVDSPPPSGLSLTYSAPIFGERYNPFAYHPTQGPDRHVPRAELQSFSTQYHPSTPAATAHRPAEQSTQSCPVEDLPSFDSEEDFLGHVFGRP